MNISQLEHIRKLITEIRAEIKTDTGGSLWIDGDLKKIENRVEEELKNLIWKRYLEAEV